MTDARKAWLEMLLTAFLGGAVGVLMPYFQSGALPPQPEWRTIAVSALVAGLAALYHRLQMPPGVAALVGAVPLPAPPKTPAIPPPPTPLYTATGALVTAPPVAPPLPPEAKP